MSTNTPQPSYRGKVRDIYDLGGTLIIQASDRLSAFDYVFHEEIPDKGPILTEISNHWFSMIQNVRNHLIEVDHREFPEPFCENEAFAKRSVWVKKAERVDFECVVRGYLLGSGYKEYQEKGSVCGISLPQGIQAGQKLSEPIFTPTTKSDTGHDEAVHFQVMEDALGSETAARLRHLTLDLYSWASSKLESVGIILLDTKFEFGFYKGELILIDEVLTPDSSRFCEKEKYETAFSKGSSLPSMDKQIIRDHLEETGWNKKPPLPSLPQDILEKTRLNYQLIQKKILSL